MLYQILSEDGLDLGLFEAATPAAALAAYCEDEGVPVCYDGETIRPASPKRIAQGPYAQNTHAA
jgi:hypothetical protein